MRIPQFPCTAARDELPFKFCPAGPEVDRLILTDGRRMARMMTRNQGLQVATKWATYDWWIHSTDESFEFLAYLFCYV